MDGQVTARTFVCAIPKAVIVSWVTKRLEKMGKVLIKTIEDFVNAEVAPDNTHELECDVEEHVRELARSLTEWSFNSLEPKKMEAMPTRIEHLGDSYRKLNNKTPHSKILTRFGNITLTRAMYRRGSRGRTIAPLEKILGIECGATPGAQDLIGRQVAAAGSSQGRCIEVIAERTGAKIGSEKLRSLSSYLADSMEPHREYCQVQKLAEWIDQVVKDGGKAILSVSRDGVSLGIAPFGNFEMASVATLSVYADGKRIGTIYLAAAPEENQATLSANFTSLLKAIIQSHGSKLSRIVYVSDAGKIETAYWKNVLRCLFVDGKRIKLHRVVDYYHASLRLTTIADSLLLTAAQRKKWLSRVRKLLLEPGGWGRVMRSIASMIEIYGLDPAKEDEYEIAKRYLHRYRRFMDYAEYRSNGSPIGSGIVESACKQIVSERLKLSGMRWAHAGAAQILTLRSILLSQTWTATFHRSLLTSPAVNCLISQ
jgi:hypothetical protein